MQYTENILSVCYARSLTRKRFRHVVESYGQFMILRLGS